MIGSKGEPVAMRALPSVHSRRSAGRASAFEVGFDSGMMIGRSWWEAISRTTRSVKAPNWAEQPMSIVGRARWTTSSRPWPCGASGQSTTSEAGRA